MQTEDFTEDPIRVAVRWDGTVTCVVERRDVGFVATMRLVLQGLPAFEMSATGHSQENAMERLSIKMALREAA